MMLGFAILYAVICVVAAAVFSENWADTGIVALTLAGVVPATAWVIA